MPDQTNRNEGGRFESEHGINAEDVLQAMEFYVPYTTGEMAEDLEIPRRTVYKYLEELYEEERISKKKPEPRRVIWMRGKTDD